MANSSWEFSEDLHEDPTVDGAIDDAGELLRHIIDRGAEDLLSQNLRLQADAYYWFACPQSELYTDIAPTFGIRLNPDMFHERVLEAGQVDFPKGGLASLGIDTGEPTNWAYFHPSESADKYVQRLNSMTREMDCLRIASLNGCEIAVRGPGATVLQAAVAA